jgi:enoyl-CoA hydratase/carnithine racemase
MRLEKHGDVAVLSLDESENRLNPDWVAEFLDLLTEVEASPSPRALVTVGLGKFFSNGLDLAWLGANADRSDEFLRAAQEVLARLLESSVPSVAAVQGHAYAAGLMLALCHDLRLMRRDRGFVCLPEVDIRIPFTPGMTALMQAKLTPQTRTQTMAFGRRYGGPDALAAGIVDAVATEDELLDAAIETASGLAGKDPATLGRIKRGLYATAIARLRQPGSAIDLPE